MSINKLNLQIGGGDQEEYEKRKVMREIAKPNTDIDSALDLFFEENVLPALNGEAPQPVRQQIQEEIVYREPRSNVDILSNYITRTVREEPEEYQNPRSLRESYTLEDRLSLLEQDVFTKMAQATPNTLVSGIGASLDSGGGAVWLWDLEDVSIGAPLNGVYPSITDGSFLAYNAAAKAWNAVEDSGAANALSGAVIKATGGAANASGDLVIEATNATNGNFTIKNASAAEKFVIDGSTGDTTFKGGRVIIERATSTTNLLIQGKTVSFPQDATSVLLGTVTASGDNSDSIRYFGTVTDNNDIANKKYVDDAIDGLDPSGGFTFKGTCNVTIATDSGSQPTVIATPSAGDFYINTTSGTAFNASSPSAANSWIGIAGLAISADQLIIYSGSSNRWFAGAVEGANPNVLKAGDTMTGPLTIAPTSGSDALIIKTGDTTKIAMNKSGDATFLGTVTTYNIHANTITPRQDDTWTLGSAALSWSSAHINTITTTAVTNLGTLDVSGTTQLGTATAATRIILGNANMVGGTSAPSYSLEGGKNANLIIKRCSDNDMSIPQIVIQGKVGTDGVKTSDLLTVVRKSGNNPDVVEYYGRTTGDNDIQTRVAGDVRYAQLASSNEFTSTQNIKVNDAQFAVTIEGSSSSVDTIRLYGNGEIQCQKITQNGSNNLSKFNGTLEVVGTITNGGVGALSLSRPTGNTWLQLTGRTTYNGSDSALFFEALKGGGTSPDKLLYYGDTTSSGSLVQNKQSVQTMIDDSHSSATWTTINKNTYGQYPPSTMTADGNWFIKYRKSNNGNTVELIIHAAKFGPRVIAGDIIGVLPTGFRPTYQCPVLFTPKNAETSLSQGYGAIGIIGTNGQIGVIHTFNDNAADDGVGGSQDYWAYLSFGLGS